MKENQKKFERGSAENSRFKGIRCDSGASFSCVKCIKKRLMNAF